MKKVLLFAILIMLIVVISGCATEVSFVPEEKEEHQQTVEATILQITETQFTAKLLAGKICTFLYTKATIHDQDALHVGDEIAIRYIDAETGYEAKEIWVTMCAPSEEADILAMLEQMSIEEKVGQMFFVRCPKEDAAEVLKRYAIGGCLLFARDFKGKSAEQVRDTIAQYQKHQKIPMFIGVDEEGGEVNRVSCYTALRNKPFLSPQELYQEGGMDLIVTDTEEKADFLRLFGINVNFAPVCDVSVSPRDYMFKRTFGQNAKSTAEYVRAVVETMQRKGMGGILKHFPGYGNNANTHTGIAHDARPYTQFQSEDFLPFEAGIDAGADCILVSHNIVVCMDVEKPASLSFKVHQILREELKFNGVIITDDLIMDAIRDYADSKSAAVLAVQAGNDMLTCSDLSQINAVIHAVKNGDITEERVDQSVLRILRWKKKLQILGE